MNEHHQAGQRQTILAEAIERLAAQRCGLDRRLLSHERGAKGPAMCFGARGGRRLGGCTCAADRHAAGLVVHSFTRGSAMV